MSKNLNRIQSKIFKIILILTILIYLIISNCPERIKRFLHLQAERNPESLISAKELDCGIRPPSKNESVMDYYTFIENNLWVNHKIRIDLIIGSTALYQYNGLLKEPSISIFRSFENDPFAGKSSIRNQLEAFANAVSGTIETTSNSVVIRSKIEIWNGVYQRGIEPE